MNRRQNSVLTAGLVIAAAIYCSSPFFSKPQPGPSHSTLNVKYVTLIIMLPKWTLPALAGVALITAAGILALRTPNTKPPAK